jgi:hypothetical protein
MANSKKKLDRIDLDELFDSPVNRGMLSFLQRPPEEARERLREKERVDRLDSNRLIYPQGESPTGSDTEGSAKSDSVGPIIQATTSYLVEGDQVSYPVSDSPDEVTHPLGNLPPGQGQPIHNNILNECVSPEPVVADRVSHPLAKSSVGLSYPLSTSPRTSFSDDRSISPPLGVQPNDPQGISPSGHNLTDRLSDLSVTQGDVYTKRPEGGDPNYLQGNSPSGCMLTDQHSDPPVTKDDVNTNAPQEDRAYPLGISPPKPTSTGQSPHLSNTTEEAANGPERSHIDYPVGESLAGHLSLSSNTDRFRNSPLGTKATKSVILEVFDGKIVGRQQKVRRAVVAQDGHSSGEQLLYQSLWNAANLETQETRVLSVGYKGMSMLCKLDHSNCKKNIRNLIEKLAVEIIDSYDRATSTGTTYRLFSYKEILRRRESAGLLWVIRANGVKFVNTADLIDKLPTLSIGNSHSGAMRNAPVASPGASLRGRVGKPPGPPLGEAHTQLGRENKASSNQSSSSIGLLLQKQLPTFDHGIVDSLWTKCRAQVPDVTEAELSRLFEAKLPFAFERGVVNPNGFLLTAVAASCTRAAIDAMRRGRELAAPQQEPDVIQTRQEQIANYESYLNALPNHPAAKLWRSKLDELREEN